MEARAIDAVSGGSVVNTPSLLIVRPSALVATTSKWYVVSGARPAIDAAVNGTGGVAGSEIAAAGCSSHSSACARS